jgi:hypothetical protein
MIHVIMLVDYFDSKLSFGFGRIIGNQAERKRNFHLSSEVPGTVEQHFRKGRDIRFLGTFSASSRNSAA